MALQNIRIPALLGGVTTVSQSQRSPIEFEAMENCDAQTTRGLDKRPGTNHIAGDGTLEELDVVDPGNDMHVFWINRSATERFVGFIDPAATSEDDILQIWNIVTGARATVKAEKDDGSEVNLTSANADVVAMMAYLAAGTNTVQQRYRTISVEDATFILNRDVATALEGTKIRYRNSTGSPVNVRNRNNAQNVESWGDFTHPPTATATYPVRSTLLAGGDITDDAIWYANEDYGTLVQGFYWAIDGTAPPWFQRLPTEGANSYIKRDTMPLRLDWNGSRFLLRLVAWEPRKAGNSTTNPGPTFIGNTLDDIAFHQDRLWFASGERIVSSRAGDLFNLWQNSEQLIVDDDPIDTGVQGRRISNVRLLESFRESLIAITDGAKQVELRANGPITPQSFQIYDSTNVFSANYVEPTVRGSQLLFWGERDYAMILWGYDYSPERVNNVATDLTERVHGYIPAEAHWATASDAHDQLFVLTLADTDAIYVNKAVFEGPEQVLSSWYRWTYPGVTKVVSCEVYDDWLYLIMERGGLYFLERQALGQPDQDTVSGQTLTYSLRMDRKVELQGVFDTGTDETTFTLPYDITGEDYHIVAGPTWDTTNVKAAGTEVPLKSESTVSGVTEAVVEGDWENNEDGTDAPFYLGLSYEASLSLSEQFVRDQNGLALSGNTKLTRMKVRHRDSGGYSILVTPKGRSQFTITYVPRTIGSSPSDGDQLDAFGEFQAKILTDSRDAAVTLSNDTPYPTAWVDIEFDVQFVPNSYSPTR